jgi:cell division protein FtsQ
MEKTIEQHGLIEDAEVFVLPSGELQVELTQKKPIVRVQNISDNEFYVTMDGNPFPLSRNYTQRVLIANGHIADSVDVAQVTKLSRYIVQDAFWKSQIIQVYLNENKEFELIPRVGNHTILLGGLEEMEEKFEKLMLFYQKGVQQTGWNNYSLINLKYKNQLVCVKR